jgi:hypothetical protein
MTYSVPVIAAAHGEGRKAMSSAVPSTWYFHQKARAAKLKFPSGEGKARFEHRASCVFRNLRVLLLSSWSGGTISLLNVTTILHTGTVSRTLYGAVDGGGSFFEPSLLGSSSLRRTSAKRSGTPSATMSAYIRRSCRPIAAITSGPSVGVLIIDRLRRVGLRTLWARIAGPVSTDSRREFKTRRQRNPQVKQSNVGNQTIKTGEPFLDSGVIGGRCVRGGSRSSSAGSISSMAAIQSGTSEPAAIAAIHDAGRPEVVREVIARRIIAAARFGECDPVRSRAEALGRPQASKGPLVQG